MHGDRYRRDSQHGLALVSVLLALALVGTLGAAVLAVGSVDFQATRNHRSSTRALLLADAGLNHGLALMRGPLATREYSELLLGDDGLADTDDDGQLIGFGLPSPDELPDTGVVIAGGRYFFRLANDPADPSGDPFVDDNYRLIAECRGETDDGGRAEVRVVLASPNFPAIATEGDLLLTGNPEVLGPCAGTHANQIATMDGIPTVDGPVTATDTVIVTGVIRDADGNEVIPQSGHAPIDVPEMNPLEYCGDADYVLRSGWVIETATGDSTRANGSPQGRWQYDPADDLYSISGNKAVPGTVCAIGNVSVSGNTGSESNPMPMSILSTGSVDVTGNPRLVASHPEDFLIMAQGDIQIGGIASGATPNYGGLLYAGSQCKVNGTPEVEGFILCKDNPDPIGAIDLTDENIINGDARITYDCTGQRRLTLVSSWWEVRSF